jgi:hypothetical protein
MPPGTGNEGAFDGRGVRGFSIEDGVGCGAGCSNARRCRRRAGAAAEPGAAQRAAFVLPQRLHGALLVSADRRRAGAQLPEAAHAGALGRMPERGECDQSGGAGSHSCRGSCCCARGTAACATGHAGGARRSAGCRTCGRCRGAQAGPAPGGSQGDWPGLPRRLSRALRRHSAGRLGIDRLPQAQRQDIVARLPAGAGERPDRRGRPGAGACTRAHCRAGRAAADGAGAAAGDAARGAVHHPQRLRRRLCRLLRRPASRSRARRGLPALQQGQSVAALPAGVDCVARRSLERR